jgi:hypothetical protein
MTQFTPDERLAIETLKLLVEVAWADREIATEEAVYLESLAEQAAVPAGELAALRVALRDERRMPAPDLTLLRRHAGEVLRAVDDLIRIDARIVDDELRVRRAIESLLSP